MFSAQGIVKPKRLEFEKKTKTDRYGKFFAGPFERGYGVTVGNSLRRMLLSSIEGAAVIGVKFEGIFHEFSSIQGVMEDVTEIILNLKQLDIKLTGTAATKRLIFKTTKPGKVLAKDIETDADVVLLNPEHHIATVDQGGKLEMEMLIQRGRGYVPAERHNLSGESVQMIPIDAIFSPIEKIEFKYSQLSH